LVLAGLVDALTALVTDPAATKATIVRLMLLARRVHRPCLEVLADDCGFTAALGSARRIVGATAGPRQRTG
jgi:hypothetical protein